MRIRKVWLIFCLCFLVGCGNGTDKEYETGVIQQEESGTNQVLMVYMVGSDLESENGLASMDVEEMVNSTSRDPGVTVLICTGGAAYWWNDEISETECAVYKVNFGTGIEKLHVLENDNMACKETLTEFMDFAYLHYPTDQYSMVFWNHGGGAVLGYGEDENYDYDNMALYELEEAIANSTLIEKGNKMEWVGFDACLMGMLEVADAMSPYAHYLIASEELEPGYGWDYSFLRNYNDDAKVNAKTIVDSYCNYYDEFWDECPEYTLSCLDLTVCDQVVSSLEDFVKVAYEELQKGNYSILAKQRDYVKSFGKISSDQCYDSVDLIDFAENYKTIFPEETASLIEVTRDMVVYNRSNILGANGVALFFPYSNKAYAKEWVEEYSKINFSPLYTGFLQDFIATLSGKVLTEWKIGNIVPDVEEQESGYSVILNQEQMNHFARAKLSVWEEVEGLEGSYVLWLNSSKTTLSEEGKLSAVAQNKHFVICDSAGHSADCSAVEIERDENSAIYEISLLTQYYDSSTGENDSGLAVVQVKVDEKYPDGKIIGIYDGEGVDGERLPERSKLSLKQGTDISPIAFVRNITVNETNEVNPFEEWEGQSQVFDTFILEGELSVTMVDIDETRDLCYVFFIADTQGNVYETNCVR